jgi:hypothetical protein
MEEIVFNKQKPSILVVEDFYKDPDAIRAMALEADYGRDLDYFKGERSTERYLLPWVREEFCRLLNIDISGWLTHGANGVFQKTTWNDPLVYHHDSQDYAAAIYLNPEGGPGTSFWRHRLGGRKAPVTEVQAEWIYNPAELISAENWIEVDRVDGLYNRLVIWDAKLIHSASYYEREPRLVQLFFFDA